MKFFLRIIFAAFLFSLATANLAHAYYRYYHGISVFGDLKYSKGFKHFEYANPRAPKGGDVQFGVEGTFNNLNPFILKGITASGISYLYDSLMEGSSDEISSYYGLIAKGVKMSYDKKSMSFRLRENATWHDGEPITSNDVVFTFYKLISDGHPSYKIIYRDVKEVRRLSDYEVEFIFKHNRNRDLPVLIASMKVLPQHYFEKLDFSRTTLDIPVGSGPYKIKEVDAGKKITYVRQKDYWGKDLPVNKGRYNFDTITYNYYRDNNILIEAFKAGKYDFRQENVARNWANSYNIEAVENGDIIKKEIPHNSPTGTQAFIFNLRKEKFQNRALRKAITYAFDFEWLKEHIFYGSYERTHSYFSNSDFGYKKFKMPRSNGDGFNRDNLIKAKEILDKAGYKISDGKLIDPKSGETIAIEFLINSEAFQMIIAPFVKHLRKLGIDAKIRFVEENQYQTRVNNFDYDIIVAVFGQRFIPGNELYSYWHSSQKDVKGSGNLSGLSNKRIDYLVEKIATARNKKDSLALCQKFDKKMLYNYYTIPQWHNGTYRILYRDIFGIPNISPKYALSIDSWWIK